MSSSVPKTKKSSAVAKPPQPKKRPLNSHQSSLSNVSDLRLHKRGRNNKNKTDEDCIVIDSDSDTEKPRSLNKKEQEKTGKSFVTPSPHPSRRQTQQQVTQKGPTPLYNSSRSHRGNRETSQTISTHFATNRDKSRVRNTSSSWFQQKKQQKTSQSFAFNSPKENPFSSYTFDPNNIEQNLDSQAIRSKEPSIFPSAVASSNFTATKPRNSRTFRTPASRRKNVSSSSRISSHDLLQRKANELNQHRHQMTSARYGINHDGMTHVSMSDPFNQQSMTAPDYDFCDLDQYSQPQQFYQQQPSQQQQQHFYNAQPQTRNAHSIFPKESFDQMRNPFGHNHESYQHMSRPSTSAGSVMSNRFMNMPRPQQIVQPQQFNRSQYFVQQQPTYQEDFFDQGYSNGRNDFPPQVQYPSPRINHEHGQQVQPQPNRFATNFQTDQMSRLYSQQDVDFIQPTSHHGMNNDNEYTSMRSTSVQNPYIQNGRPRAASSVVNPYRQQSQDCGPPMEVVVQNDAINGSVTSQFEDAFFG